jgi:hypothetical protein
MSDEEISRDPETRGPEAKSSTDSSCSPEDSLVLFSQQLDSALGKNKKELFAEIDVTICLKNVDRFSRFLS